VGGFFMLFSALNQGSKRKLKIIFI
jgi:hypothetical protein